MRPRSVLLVITIAHNVAPFLLGIPVVKTVVKGIIEPHAPIVNAVNSAVLKAIVWNIITWTLDIPSSSYLLLGSLLGTTIISKGNYVLQY